MGVPITFLDKYNPKPFERVRFNKGEDGKHLRIKERSLFFRILIKKRSFPVSFLQNHRFTKALTSIKTQGSKKRLFFFNILA